MTMCNEQNISFYVDGELSRADREVMKAHLEECKTCRAVHESLMDLHALSRRTYPLQRFTEPKATARRPRKWLPASLAAAVLLAIVGVGWAALRDGGDDVEEIPELAEQVSETRELPSEMPASNVSTQAQPASSTPSTREQRDDVMHLTGVVTDVNDRPLRGVQVYTAGLNWRSPTQASESMTVYASTMTDSEGRFEIDREPLAQWVYFDSRGYGQEAFRIVNTVFDAEIELEAKLVKARRVSGRVMSPSGVPLQAASVTLDGQVIRGGPTEVARTDENGRYSIHVATAHGIAALRATHPDFAPATIQTREDGTVGDLMLAEAGGLEVRVVRGGRPIEGAYVVVSSPDVSRHLPIVARTDETGRVQVGGLAEGVYRAVARTANGDISKGPRTALNVLPETVIETRVELPESYQVTLVGDIVGLEKPVGGYYPLGLNFRSPVNDETVTRVIPVDDDGRFTAGLELGASSLVMMMLPYPTHVMQGEARRRIQASGLNQRVQVRYEVRPRDTYYEVQMQDAQGMPIRRARIHSGGLGGWGSVQAWLTSEDGTARFTRPPRSLSLYDPDRQVASTYADFNAEDEWPQVLTVSEPVRTLRGMVVDQEGNGLEGAVLLVYGRSSGAGMSGTRISATAKTPIPFSQFSVVTDALGEFAIEPVLESADYSVFVTKPGYEIEGGRRGVERAADSGDGPWVIRMARKAGVIEGVVLWADNVPTSNAHLAVIGNGPVRTAYANDEGLFRLNVPAGTYTVQANARGTGYVTPPVEVHSSDGMITLEFEEASYSGDGETPEGEEHEQAQGNLKQAGLAFLMFANESRGQKFPALSMEYGMLEPDLSILYPEYIPDLSVLPSHNDTDVRWIYTGHLLTNDANGEAFLDAYEEFGPEEVANSDVQVAQGFGNGSSDRIFQLRNGIERFVITDINTPGGGAFLQSTIPIMWELPGSHEESGGWVLYLDGHTEWMDYPGRFPMTEAFTERVRTIVEE